MAGHWHPKDRVPPRSTRAIGDDLLTAGGADQAPLRPSLLAQTYREYMGKKHKGHTRKFWEVVKNLIEENPSLTTTEARQRAGNILGKKGRKPMIRVHAEKSYGPRQKRGICRKALDDIRDGSSLSREEHQVFKAELDRQIAERRAAGLPLYGHLWEKD